MSYIKVYVHFVWTTKLGKPFLGDREIRNNVWQHIKSYAKTKDIFVDVVNGYKDHCHCLVSMGPEHTLGQVMQQIKGESSYWINKHNLCKARFSWQKDYYAISVNGHKIDRVRNYILNQEEHHKKATFKEEYDDFIEKYGFQHFF